MDKIKAFFATVGRFLLNLYRDFTSALREGDGTSAYSSKRIAGVTLIVVGIKLLFVGAGAFCQIMDKGWYSVLVFTPSALCFTFATIYFYINGKIDIATATEKAKEIAVAMKKE